MPDLDDVQDGKNYHLDKPHNSPPFKLKGSNSLDWGMKNRMQRVFRPADGRTVMLAVDHGYFQGPTTGLESPGKVVAPLLPYADALMCTRGLLSTSVAPASPAPVVLRVSGGSSILRELSDEEITTSMEDAIRLNAVGVGMSVFIGSENERQTVVNLGRLVNEGERWGMPVLLGATGLLSLGLGLMWIGPAAMRLAA